MTSPRQGLASILPDQLDLDTAVVKRWVLLSHGTEKLLYVSFREKTCKASRQRRELRAKGLDVYTWAGGLHVCEKAGARYVFQRCGKKAASMQPGKRAVVTRVPRLASSF